MKQDTGYIPLESTPPLRGLATSPPSNKINPSYSPRLLNVVVRDGVVRKRAGGVQLGQQLVGKVLAITEFGPLDEDPYCVVLTTRRQYVYDTATEEFLDLTPGKTNYAITAVSTGLPRYFTVAGDQTAVFTVGRLFNVDSGPNKGVYTVSSSTLVTGDTRIGTEELISSNTVTGNCVVATDLTTQDTDFISFVAVTDTTGHRFIFTNGRDAPRVWDGNTGNNFANWAPTYTGFVTCKLMVVFQEHLLLLDVTTASVQPLLVAWSKAGEMDDFETGDSGSQLLYQLKSRPKAARVLGDRLVIYSKDAILTGVSVGLPAVFQFELLVPEGTRFASPRGVVSINVGHIYVSEENFYLFDGSRGLRVLGDGIYTDYKQTKNQETLYLAAGLNDYSKRTIYFSIPAVAGGTVIYTAEYDPYNLSEITWAKEQYSDTVSAWGFFVNRTITLDWEDASWEDANMPWEEELGSWSEESEQLNFPIRTYGTPDGFVVIVTEGVASDLGVSVFAEYETKDFELPEVAQSQIGRWGEIEAEMSGTSVTVEYSTDRGKTFQAVNDSNTTELTEVATVYQIPIDVTSRNLRVKFTSSSNFRLHWVKVWVKPGGPQ